MCGCGVTKGNLKQLYGHELAKDNTFGYTPRASEI